MRLVTTLLALLCIVMLIGMTIAPRYPQLRDVYATTLCPTLDRISPDICAAVRRTAPGETL